MPRPSSRTVRVRCEPVSAVTSTRRAAACRATLDSASRSTASISSATRAGTRASSRPSIRSHGAKPSARVISSVMAAIRACTPGGSAPASPRSWSRKIAARMSLIVSSSSSTACWTRPAASAPGISDVAPCSDMPVANSRWMTRSCRSRAIRSRSAYSATRWAAWRRSASSMPMPAWAAKVATMSAAAGASGGEPRRRAAVSTPRTSPGRPTGTSTAGPRLSRPRTTSAARRSELTSSRTSGWPLAITIPEADRWVGEARPSASAAPSPAAYSMATMSALPAGSAMNARSAPEICSACSATMVSTAVGSSSDSSRWVTSAWARTHCRCRRDSACSRELSTATPATAASATASASSSAPNSPPSFLSVRYRLP